MGGESHKAGLCPRRFPCGHAALIKDTIEGVGNIGVDLFQYEGQTLASESSANGIKVNDQSETALKVESDKAAGDIPGKFSAINSTFTGDGNVLINESNTFAVTL